MASPLRGILAVAVVAVALACSTAERDPGAPELALELFRAARDGVKSEDLALLLDGEPTPAGRVALEALLGELRRTTAARVVALGPAGDRTAVDVEAALPGGGTARYHVQAREVLGAWRIVSVAGPGSSWPSLPSPRGDGLTTSAPPSPL